MTRTTTVHWLKNVDNGCYPSVCSTHCGKRGFSEGANEWTTSDGHEARFEAQPKPQGVTCKRCLRSLEAQTERFKPRIR